MSNRFFKRSRTTAAVPNGNIVIGFPTNNGSETDGAYTIFIPFGSIVGSMSEYRGHRRVTVCPLERRNRQIESVEVATPLTVGKYTSDTTKIFITKEYRNWRVFAHAAVS